MTNLAADATTEVRRTDRRLRELDVRMTLRVKMFMGLLELSQRQPDQAITHLHEAEKGEPWLPELHVQIGRVYVRMQRWEDAAPAFRKALEIDGESPYAHNGMAQALLRLRWPTAAAAHALIAVGLLHHLPQTHLRLGIALTRLPMLERVIKAFETCAKLATMAIVSHRWLERNDGLRCGRSRARSGPSNEARGREQYIAQAIRDSEPEHLSASRSQARGPRWPIPVG